MKKILLATTAATAALAMAGVAQAAEPLKLGIGGYFNAYGIFNEQDDTAGTAKANRRSFDIWREAEVWFLGSTKLDNGITVGIDVQLEAETCGDQIDESYLWFEGGFGKVILGSENSAAYLLTASGPTADDNFDSLDPNVVPVVVDANSAPTVLVANITGDAEKFTYLSPRFGGFQAGLSYAPDASCEQANGLGCGTSGAFPSTTNDAGAFENVWALGANWSGDFQGFKVSVGGGYERGSLEAATATVTDDREAWSAGGSLGWAGFTFGGAYGQDNLGGAGDAWGWTAGVGYGTGPYKVALTYWASETEETGGDDELTRLALGGSYAMGPGIELRASVSLWSLEGQGPTEENDATLIAVGTRIAF